MNAQQAIKRLRDALSLAECNYRINIVKDGEPSSMLADMQQALAATVSIAERVALSDSEILEAWGEYCPEICANPLPFARAILSAQADAPPITQPLIAEAARDGSMMAECMDMVRQELIEAGIIDKTVPPMMVSDAVLAYIASAKRDDVAGDAAKSLIDVALWWSESSMGDDDADQKLMDAIDSFVASKKDAP